MSVPEDRDMWVVIDQRYPTMMRMYFTEDEARDRLTRKDTLYKARLADWEELT